MTSYLEQGLSTIGDALGLSSPAPAKRTKKAGRNDPCPCGSGTKYKKCCLRKERSSRPARPSRSIDQLATELMPRVDDEVCFGEDLQTLSTLIASEPACRAIHFDAERVRSYLEQKGLLEKWAELSGEEVDEVAVRYCREVEGGLDCDGIARALLEIVPSHAGSTDDLRAIMTGLMMLDMDSTAESLLGITLFRLASPNPYEKVAKLLDALDSRGDEIIDASPGELSELIESVMEGESLDTLGPVLDQMENTEFGRGFLKVLEASADEMRAEVQAALGEVHLRIPYPTWLLAFLEFDAFTPPDRIRPFDMKELAELFGRLTDAIDLEDQHLFARYLEAWLEENPSSPHQSAFQTFALLCETGQANLELAHLALSRLSDAHFAVLDTFEHAVLVKGADASEDEVEAIARRYEEEGFPAIATRIRRDYFTVHAAFAETNQEASM